MTITLLVDSTFLCHRAFHTTGQLTYKEEATGVAFGFLRELNSLTQRYFPDTIMFAFDSSGPGIRNEIYPEYKFSRRNKVRSDEEKESYNLFKDQVKKLKRKILPELGYNNIFSQRGYEADDIIAYFAERVIYGDKAIIVTADNDMWQCLAHNISWYNPSSKANNKLVTRTSFNAKYNIDPAMWASVKALAGCRTDDIEGIEGIGDITAAKWFAGTLDPKSKKYKTVSDNLEVHNRNIKLTRLPLSGLELPELQADEATDEKKMKMQFDLGIRHRRRPKKKPDKKPKKKLKFSGFDI